MERIPEWIEEKWHIPAFESERAQNDKRTYYQTVLNKTDHIPRKFDEAEQLEKYFGEGRSANERYTEEDMKKYKELLEARKFCREKIGEMEDEAWK